MKQTKQLPAWCQVQEIKLSYKSKVKFSDRPVIIRSEDCADIFKQTWDEDTLELTEAFKVMLVNKANRVIGIYQVATGGFDAVHVDIRLIFISALKSGANGIFLCHNHPTGLLRPSQADRLMTGRIAEGAKILGITLQDHIIIAKEGYYSFADNAEI
jgi:DNA repair protein RadC